MKQLRNRSNLPGRMWPAYIAATNTRLEDFSRQALIPRVAAHLRGNNLPPMVNPEEEIDDYICAALSEKQQARMCQFRVEGDYPTAVTTGLADVMAFVDFVMENGIKFVPQEEAERRARICAQCPLNVPVSGCSVCEIARTLMDKSAKLLAGRTTEQDSKLKACACCGCQLQAKVHLDMKVPYRNAKFPSHCWQNSVKESDGQTA